MKMNGEHISCDDLFGVHSRMFAQSPRYHGLSVAMAVIPLFCR